MGRRVVFHAVFSLALCSISSTALAIASAGDADGDGIPDNADAFPCDATRAAAAYLPSETGFSTLLFEDNWPARGDLDFNDAALLYNVRAFHDASGRLSGLRVTLIPRAIGAHYDNGIGFRLPVPASAATSIRRTIGSAAATAMTAQAGESELVIAVIPSLFELFPPTTGYINTAAGTPAIGDGPVVTLDIALNPSAAGAVSLGEDTIDLFMFRSGDLTHQIHRPQFAGTAIMNAALFGTADDGSTAQRHFVDRSGLPFALAIPAQVAWPLEFEAVSGLWPDIVAFASSGGTLATDFYLTDVDLSKAAPQPADAILAHDGADQSCVAEPMVSCPAPSFHYQDDLSRFRTVWGTTGSEINRIRYLDGQLVAVGNRSKIATSADGATWSYRPQLSDQPWVLQSGWGNVPDIAHSGARYVAMNTPSAALSSDLTSWSSAPFPAGVQNGMLSVIWAGSRFFGITGYGNSISSTDGSSWTYNQRPAQFGIGIGAVNAVWDGARILAFGSGLSTSPDGVEFTRNDAFGNASLGGWGSDLVGPVAYNGSSTYVMVGALGRAASSPDGVTWTMRPGLPLQQSWNDVIWTGTQFMAVGGNTSTGLATSPDGITWTAHAGLNAAMGGLAAYTVVWTGTQYVVGGQNGSIATSPDGVTWTLRPSLASTTWGSGNLVATLVWTGTQLVAGGPGGRVATSPDGITWTYRNGLSTTTYGTANIESLAWTGTQLVAAGSNARVGTSPNGITWTYRSGLTSGAGWGSSFVGDVVWTGTQLVALGGGGRVATSADGITWTNRTGLQTSGWGNAAGAYNLRWAGSRLFAGGELGHFGTSADGVSWTYDGTSFTTPYTLNSATQRDMAIGGGAYVTVGEGATFARSPDGNTWTAGFLPGWGTATARAVVWTGSRFVAAGAGGRVATSPDGSSWTNQPGLASTRWSTADVVTLAWNGSVVVAGGGLGLIATSPDGVTWTYQDGLAQRDTIYGQNNANLLIDTAAQLVTAGADGRVATSPDGTTWTYRPSLRATAWGTGAARGGAWTGSSYVLVGDGGRAATSPDGITWTYQPGLAASAWGTGDANALVWTGTRLVAGGTNGRLATSLDGVTWTLVGTELGSTWSSTFVTSLFTDGSVVVAGSANGRVASSSDGVVWTDRGLAFGVAGRVYTFASNGSSILVFGEAGRLATSSDGIIWTPSTTLRSSAYGSSFQTTVAAWNGVEFLIAGPGGRSATSPDGVTWTYRAESLDVWRSGENPNALVARGCRFVMVGTNGRSMTY